MTINLNEMKRFVLISIYTLLSSLAIVGRAETNSIHIPIQQISTDNGLSHTTVLSIYRDEFGFVWIGTTDGLNRFDGHSVTTFRYDSEDDTSIKANNITEICGNGNGLIYIKGQKCLISYDLRKERFKTIHEDGINAITYSNGLHYASGNMVFRINPDNSEECIYKHNEPTHISTIRVIRFDTEGNMFIATSSNDIIRVSPDGRQRKFRFENIYSLDTDEYGNTWVSTRTSGFIRIDPDGNCSEYIFKGNSQQALDRNNVRSVVHAYGSKYYIGTYDGLLLYDITDGEIQSLTYDLRRGFENHAVRLLYKSGNLLFIGSFHAGFQYYNTEEGFQQTFAPAFHHGTLSSPIISSVCKDIRGILWIGSISGGLTVIDPERRIDPGLHRKIKSCKMLYNIKGMHYDRVSDELWITTFSEGLVRIDISDNTLEEISLGEPIQNIIKIMPLDQDRLILCSTIDGLFSLNKKTMKISSLNSSFGLGNIGVINDIAVYDDKLWICTDNQILKIDLASNRIINKYSTSTFPGMLAEHTIRCIFCRSNGELWAGTSGAGIFRYDCEHDSFINCTAGKYHGNNFINHITEGNLYQNRLYFATNDGISILDTENCHFDIINRSSMLPLSITDFVYVSDDSTIYCSGMQGLYAAKEETISKSDPQNPRFLITGLMVDNQKVVPDDNDSSPLAVSTLFQKSITLKHSISSVAFEVANSSLDPSSNLSFEYMLEGFDTEFIKPYSNTIHYTNLTPGRYTLHVRSYGSDIDSEKMDIRILPPVYARWWFICAIILLSCIITYTITSYYINKRQLNDKLREAEREREMTQAKVEFFANVSHEFRTPLTLINSYLEVMLLSNSMSPENYRNLNGALANTTKLRDMINEFIDASKSDGQIRLNMTYSFVRSFVYEYYTVFADYAQQKNINLVFESNVDENLSVAFDRIHIGRALSNLITNAFKYTSGSGTIKFEISQDKEYLHICVEDNGRGIQKEDIGNVFRRFWQEKDANEGLAAKGSGIGLSYVKTIVELHNGKVGVSSVPGVSTRFTISLPINNSLCGYVPPFSSVIDAEEDIDQLTEREEGASDRYNVMIVEDNDELRGLLQRIFSNHFNVITAPDGAIALSTIEQNPVDLVVSDVMMPNMSGIELCNILKSQPSTSHIPVVLLTALNAEGSIIKGLNTGADDYITKPFSTKILVARCNNILAMRKQLQLKYQVSAESNIEMLTENHIDSDILQKAIQIIESNLSAPSFDIIDFAQELGLSRTSLFNKIKSLTGMTPNNFMIDIKLKHAANSLLKNGSDNVSNIAYACGFNTLSHFNKLFKKTYGMTPSEYRASHK